MDVGKEAAAPDNESDTDDEPDESDESEDEDEESAAESDEELAGTAAPWIDDEDLLAPQPSQLPATAKTGVAPSDEPSAKRRSSKVWAPRCRDNEYMLIVARCAEGDHRGRGG